MIPTSWRPLFGPPSRGSDTARRHSARCFILLAALAPGFGTAARAADPGRWQTVYSNGFDRSAGPEWSNRATDRTPRGEKFLGQFGPQSTRLTLARLPAHAEVRICFDLFIIRSWDGNSPVWGPDEWSLSVVNGPKLLHTTFSNGYDSARDLRQAYPKPFPGGSYPGRTRSADSNVLGFAPIAGYPGVADTLYKLSYTFPHTAGSVAFDFTGRTRDSHGAVPNESWGIDNVQVLVRSGK